MNELQIIKTPIFNENTYDVYSDGARIFMTRQQVGKALGYSEPQKAVDKIHARHKERLEPYSVTPKLVGTDGKSYFTTVYNQRGIMEICRWSNSPIADQFMDWVWDIIEAYRDGSLVPYRPVPHYTDSCALTEESVAQMIDDKIDGKFNSIKEDLRDELLRDLSESTKAKDAADKQIIGEQVQTAINDDTQSPLDVIDVIRAAIVPLAQKLNDCSNGYTTTYRKVYDHMNVGWSNRQRRYKNMHCTKRKPSKQKLISEDPNLLKLFIQTANGLLSKLETMQG